MCIDLTKPTFNTAIETVVQELLMAGQAFTAHDITEELRKRAAAGTVFIDRDETGEIFINGNPQPRIAHDEVREVVHDLFHQGKMTGFDRSNNGSYWLYERAAATVQPDDDDDTAQLVDDAPAQLPPAPPPQAYDGTPTLIDRLLRRLGL